MPIDLEAMTDPATAPEWALCTGECAYWREHQYEVGDLVCTACNGTGLHPGVAELVVLAKRQSAELLDLWSTVRDAEMYAGDRDQLAAEVAAWRSLFVGRAPTGLVAGEQRHTPETCGRWLREELDRRRRQP